MLEDDFEYDEAYVNQASRVKPVFLNYAKTAKKVDVKRLKTNIWKNLSGVAEEMEQEEKEEPQMRIDPTLFTQVIGSLREVYPEKKMNDISVSFCFICLLHLANEKNLEIHNDETGELAELTIMKKA